LEEELLSKKSHAETKFGTIEGAAEYLGLLLESVNEAREDLEAETALASAAGAERRQQAIQLASYKLSQLKMHLSTSRRLLNDLRTIRRLLFAERLSGPLAAADPGAGQFVTKVEDPAQPPVAVERKRLAPNPSPRPTTTS
jgi:hypothetical protein